MGLHSVFGPSHFKIFYMLMIIYDPNLEAIAPVILQNLAKT